MSTAKVVIADDHPLFRTALRQALAACTEDDEILEAQNFGELLNVIKQQAELELVFLDLHMPGNDGFTAISSLQNHHPDLTVVMVSSEDNPDMMRKALALGASAFIPKSADFNTIAYAVNQVREGHSWLPEGIDLQDDSSEDVEYRQLAEQLSQLTPQQYTVLEMIANGRLNKQIAYDLNIQETTVKKHVSAVLAKFGVNNRTQLGVAFQQLRLKGG
ncbi:MAG: response regulator transcription factor [Psychrosphaera sp.]|nr:response regulator transcription factor [Psychrosphaera sp.]